MIPQVENSMPDHTLWVTVKAKAQQKYCIKLPSNLHIQGIYEI